MTEMTKSAEKKELRLLHGADYNPEQWLKYPEILKRDIELMQKAKINCVSIGIFSWADLEPEEGVYHFEWLDKVIDDLYAGGISVILATPSGAKPFWMSEKYPEIRRVSANLTRDLSGERHNHCYTSPIYREKVKKIDTLLAKRYGTHPAVILWHLSNEYGGECYCPLCQEAFREFLKEKYKTLDRLNEAWWTHFWSHTYTQWSQIQAPVPNGERSVHGLWLDWKRFVTAQTVSFMQEEILAVKSQNPNIPVTTNMMGFYEKLNYFKFAKDIDIVSWDNYPLWHSDDNIAVASFAAASHDLMRSIKGDSFLLMESSPGPTNWQSVSKQKKPGMHELASMQAMAHGANSVQYFQWRQSRGSFEKFHAAVVDHYGGEDTRMFREVSQVGKNIEALQELLPKTKVEAQIAVLYDWENRWAVEEAKGPRNCGIHYLETVCEHHRALWEMGLQTDIIDMEQDLSKYRLIIAPMLYMYRANISQKLQDFVKNGGILVGTYWSGVVDDTDLCYLGGRPGDGMKEVFGVRVEEIDGLYDFQENYILSDGFSFKVTELCEIIKPEKDVRVLSVYSEDYYAGKAAVTANTFGKGRAYYVAAKAGMDFYRMFYKKLAKKAGVARSLSVDLPYGITAHRRVGNEFDLIFLENYTDSSSEILLPCEMTDVLIKQTVKKVSLAPYGIKILCEKK